MTRTSLWALAILAGSLLAFQAACGGAAVDARAGAAERSAAVSPSCETPPQYCWLTSGGTKIRTNGTYDWAKHGPQVSFGGNVYPSCSPDPGDGGQWNHVDRAAGLHFMGTHVVVDECGNLPVEVHPPGSESPVTSYNFIRFHGTGWIQGEGGNKQERVEVCFEARAEDRAEPGTRGQTDPTWHDRYFIHVFDCDSGADWLWLGTADEPLDVTTGNLQLHESSCP